VKLKALVMGMGKKRKKVLFRFARMGFENKQERRKGLVLSAEDVLLLLLLWVDGWGAGYALVCFWQVRMTEKGLRGSWHPAVVTAVKPGTRVVEYEELVSDDGSGRKLKEMISVGRGVDGLRASSRQFSKTPPSSKRTRILLRPQPPVLSSLGKASWSKGLWVDVFWKDAWWEGILVEDILSERAGAKAVVYFPDEGGQEMCLVKDLRLRQEWDEDTGNWSFKGRAELLELQDPSAFKKGPEFAVKKLNFDKKLPQMMLVALRGWQQKKERNAGLVWQARDWKD
jgi:hypothetical protein